jgi:UPF0148 protein
MKKPDEIMAEYLLKGGKMLAKTCPACEAPLFEYKGETICVVCAEKGTQPVAAPPVPQESRTVQAAPSLPLPAGLEESLVRAVSSLCERACTENRPEDCLVFMQAARIGIEALQTLKWL